MTNGEKLQSIFPNMEWEVKDSTVLTDIDNGSWFSLDWWNAEYKEPTTKNDLSSATRKNSEKLESGTTKNDFAQDCYQDLIEHFGDEKVAKTILESRKEFKAWLERLRWNVKRADELARELEQIKSTTKKNLEVDCISRSEVLKIFDEWFATCDIADRKASPKMKIKALPSVTPQEPKMGHWTEEFNDLEGEVRFTCSSCGKYQLFGTDFCYHCGSDNREVVEE